MDPKKQATNHDFKSGISQGTNSNVTQELVVSRQLSGNYKTAHPSSSQLGGPSDKGNSLLSPNMSSKDLVNQTKAGVPN